MSGNHSCKPISWKSHRRNCYDNAVAVSFFSCSSASASDEKITQPANRRGMIFSIILNFSTTPDESMEEMGCCLPSISKNSKNGNCKVSRKRRASQFVQDLLCFSLKLASRPIGRELNENRDDRVVSRQNIHQLLHRV